MRARVLPSSGLVPAEGINLCEIFELDTAGTPIRGFVHETLPDRPSADAELQRFEDAAAQNHENIWYALVFPDGSW